VAYTVEILPYQIRAKGLAVFNISISISLVFNQYVNPIALGALEWKYYILYVCLLAFEFVYFYFCEWIVTFNLLIGSLRSLCSYHRDEGQDP